MHEKLLFATDYLCCGDDKRGGSFLKSVYQELPKCPMCRYLFDDLDNSVVHVCISELVNVSVFLLLNIKARKDCTETRGLTPNSLRIQFDIYSLCNRLKKLNL